VIYVINSNWLEILSPKFWARNVALLRRFRRYGCAGEDMSRTDGFAKRLNHGTKR